ncbi:MAG: hypothetical protein AAF485_17410, partial [Chloroflexota bacterium]
MQRRKLASRGVLPKIWLMSGILFFSLLACSLGRASSTAIPAGRPVSFEIQTATPTLNPLFPTATTAAVAEPTLITQFVDAPTHTPDPNKPATLPPIPTDTPSPAETEIILEPTPTDSLLVGTSELTPSVEATEEVVATAPPPQPVSEPDPPLQGGEWDFETDFVPWPNPYGEPCPGASVASGWTAFVEEGSYGSSCMNENLYQPNVFSGQKSQEITFDFIAANSGIYRTIPTQIGHRYNIIAYAKHDRSIA